MVEKIIPKYIGENIDRSKQRRKLIDELINDQHYIIIVEHTDSEAAERARKTIEKLEKLRKLS